VGAVIENLRIQAAADGMSLDVAYLGGQQIGDAACAVSLREDSSVSVPAERVAAMQRRTVNRRPFRRQRPGDEQLAALERDPVPGTETHIYTERKDVRTWSRLIYLADRIRYGHPHIHQELFGKIRYSRREIDRERTGLEYDRLGIGPAAPLILRTLRPWKRMHALSRVGVDAALARQSQMLGLSSGAIGLVTIPGNTPEDWMRGGEQVERLWVAAEELGLCTHPMTVALYLHQRFVEEGMEHFEPSHRRFLEAIGEGVQGYLGGRIGAIVFRLGKGFPMRGPAVRLPLDAFVAPGG
jgi:hypothetical protein